MSIRRTLAVLAIAGLGVAVTAGGAWAEYGSGSGAISVSTSSPTAGGELTVSGEGFLPGSSVKVVLHSDPVTLATLSASATGSVSSVVTIPSGTPAGAHTLVLEGIGADGQPLTLTTAIEVVAAGATNGSSGLPRTGVAIGGLVLVGAALLGAGVVLSRTARRRSASV